MSPPPEFRAPAWLPDGHSQTIWPALRARSALAGRLPFVRERWDTPDGDFVDVDRAPATGAAPGAPADAPLLVLFHGLEGSSASHYALSFGLTAHARGWHFAVPHFRGCSGEMNRAPRAYHCGDFAEIGWMLERFAREHRAPVLAVGVSLGGNALLRWAAEAGEAAGAVVRAAAAVCSPLDMAPAGAAMSRGFNRQVYARMFLRTMKANAHAKWRQYPGLFDRERMARARTLAEFDDVFTAPLHGFRGVDDYYARASARPHLARIRVPVLALNARNDPFIPPSALPRPGEVGPHVTLWQPAHGGHVGFAGHVMAMPAAVCDWLAAH